MVGVANSNRCRYYKQQTADKDFDVEFYWMFYGFSPSNRVCHAWKISSSRLRRIPCIIHHQKHFESVLNKENRWTLLVAYHFSKILRASIASLFPTTFFRNCRTHKRTTTSNPCRLFRIIGWMLHHSIFTPFQWTLSLFWMCDALF